MTADRPACSSCFHHVGGHCRRFPPITMHGGWPRLESPNSDWCGEHKPIPVVAVAPEPVEPEPPSAESADSAPMLPFSAPPRSKRPRP